MNEIVVLWIWAKQVWSSLPSPIRWMVVMFIVGVVLQVVSAVRRSWYESLTK